MFKLIVITGIDGAGKSTLARSLVSRLQSRSLPAACLYGRPRLLLSRLLLSFGRALFLRNPNIPVEDPRYTALKQRLTASPYLSAAYTLAVYIDFYVQIWFKLLPRRPRRETLILDRYIYDTVINDLAAHLSYTPERTHAAIRRSLNFLPMPAYVLLIDLPAETAFQRKNDIPHIDYLHARRPLYISLLDFPNVWVLDGCKAPAALLHDAEEIISQTGKITPLKPR